MSIAYTQWATDIAPAIKLARSSIVRPDFKDLLCHACDDRLLIMKPAGLRTNRSATSRREQKWRKLIRRFSEIS